MIVRGCTRSCDPKLGAAFEPICGGQMIFAGLNSPIGHAAGLGFDGTVSEADLDRLEMFYRSHGAPAQLDLCPLTDPTLLELLNLPRLKAEDSRFHPQRLTWRSYPRSTGV